MKKEEKIIIFTMNLFCRKKPTNKKNKNTQKKESHTSLGHSVSDNLVRTRSEGRNSTEYEIQKKKPSFRNIYNLCYFKQGVDYASMGNSNEFLSYIKHTAELQRVKLEGMTREETLAFFINIYNALVIHATVVKGPPVNLWQRYKVTV